MRREKRSAPPAVGGASLLVVFAALCLTVFALLSLTTVRANGRLADASAQAVSDYYAADLAAQEILARLRAGELPEGVERDGETYSYVCPISDTQELQVEAWVRGTAYRILRWQAASSGVWEGDDSLDLWDGVLF